MGEKEPQVGQTDPHGGMSCKNFHPAAVKGIEFTAGKKKIITMKINLNNSGFMVPGQNRDDPRQKFCFFRLTFAAVPGIFR